MTTNCYASCKICEHSFPILRLFVSECKYHYLCRKCAKSFYEDVIESGAIQLKCPFYFCNAKMDIKTIRNIISEEHIKLFNKKSNNNSNNNNKNSSSLIKYDDYIQNNFNSQLKEENVKLYMQKHVIDVNNNKYFFNYNKTKELVCINCHQLALFAKNNTHFMRCLNCNFKECKYCLKEFTDRHINVDYEEHCKVYFRKEDVDFGQRGKCLSYLLELFFVIASFYFLFAGSYIYIYRFFRKCLKINYEKNCWNITKSVFLYIISIFVFFITVPFLFIWFPYFPSILSMFECG